MDQKHLSKLHHLLNKHFDEGELRTLCFDLGKGYDDLPGRGKAEKAREIVAYFERYGRLSELLKTVKRLRPKASWEDMPETIKNVSEDMIRALHQLPPPPADFTGREKEIEELVTAIEQDEIHILGLQGMGGVGKTVLALKLASKLRKRYPDAQFYLNLKGDRSEPLTSTHAMAHIIRAYYPTAQLPSDEAELQGWYHTVLHNQSALLLMDNAKDAEQVASLVPPTSCVLLVTSRKHFRLPGMFTKRLKNLQPDEAREFLLKIAPCVEEYADQVSRLCGYLPLALRLTASALSIRADLESAEYARRLIDTQTRLKVEDSLNLSYELLDDDLKQLFNLLTIFPGTFDSEAAATLWQLTPDLARDKLGSLMTFSLVHWDQQTRLYSLHDLVRLFADNHLDENERIDGQERHAHHYFQVAQLANKLLGTEQEAEGLARFDLEQPNLVAAHQFLGESCSDNRIELFCKLQAVLKRYYDRSGRWEERKLMLEQAIEALRASGSCSQHDLGLLEIQLADIYRRQLGNLDIALKYYHAGLNRVRLDKLSPYYSSDELYRKLGDMYRSCGEFKQALTHYKTSEGLLPKKNAANKRGKLLSSVAEAYGRSGIDPEKALAAGKESLKLNRTVGDPYEIVQSHRILADVHLTRGEVEEAAVHIDEAYTMFKEAGQINNPIMGWIWRTRGDVLLLQGDPHSALNCYEQALEVFKERRVRIGVAVILKRFGLWQSKYGDVRLALEHLKEAISVARTVAGGKYVLAETLLSRIEIGFVAEQMLAEHSVKYRQKDLIELDAHVVENNRLKAEFTELVKDDENLVALWAHFNYICKRSETIIGIANSVSVALRFDPLDTLAYANEHDFRLVQVYLNKRITNTDLSEKVMKEAQLYGIRLMCHAPGFLNQDSVTESDIVASAHTVLQNTRKKWVVYHFDEKEPLDKTFDLVARIARADLVPCIENFHQLDGPEQARENYRLFLELFSKIKDQRLPAYAVLDIPRLFNSKLGLGVEEASQLTLDVFKNLADLDTPILLHLIDSQTFEQAREDYCALGTGVIPFAKLLKQMFATAARIEAVIFEFEDKQNPLESWPFLEERIYAGVSVNYPRLSVHWLG